MCLLFRNADLETFDTRSRTYCAFGYTGIRVLRLIKLWIGLDISNNLEERWQGSSSRHNEAE